MRGRKSAISNAVGWLSLISGALGACGGKSLAAVPSAQRDTSAIFGSGTRLKAHYLDGGGGARQLLDFYDTESNTACEFVASASGQYHCLPTAQATSYFDADCSEPAYVYQRFCGETPPAAGVLVSVLTTQCDSLVQAYSLVEERAVSTLYSSSANGCVAQTSPPATAWSLVQEPLTRFVGGALSVFGADGGLQARRVTGDDGTFVNRRLMAAGKPCDKVMVRGVSKCIPGLSAPADSKYFDSASCEGSPLAVRGESGEDRCAGLRPEYVVESQLENCVQNDSLYAPVDDVASVFHVDPRGQCLSYNRDDTGALNFYHAGAALSAEDAPLSGTVRVGSGALGLPCQTDRDGVPILEPDPTLRVAQRWLMEDGRNCFAVSEPSGSLRCVPLSFLSILPNLFSDANCTHEVVESSPHDCTDELPRFPIAVDLSVDMTRTACVWTASRVYTTKAYSGTHYLQHEGDCSAVPASDGSLFFSMATELDWASFPALTEATDP